MKNFFDQIAGRTFIVSPRHTVRSTVKCIKQVATDSAHDEKIISIANTFRNATRPEREIFNYVYDNVVYYPDADDYQDVKYPQRTLADKNGNCVDYAALISSLLLVLNIPHSLRIVSYHDDGEYEHIYIVTESGYILDPVINQRQDGTDTFSNRPAKGSFDKELQYTRKKDFPMLRILGATVRGRTNDPALLQGRSNRTITRRGNRNATAPRCFDRHTGLPTKNCPPWMRNNPGDKEFFTHEPQGMQAPGAREGINQVTPRRRGIRGTLGKICIFYSTPTCKCEKACTTAFGMPDFNIFGLHYDDLQARCRDACNATNGNLPYMLPNFGPYMCEHYFADAYHPDCTAISDDEVTAQQEAYANQAQLEADQIALADYGIKQQFPAGYNNNGIVTPGAGTQTAGLFGGSSNTLMYAALGLGAIAFIKNFPKK